MRRWWGVGLLILAGLGMPHTADAATWARQPIFRNGRLTMVALSCSLVRVCSAVGMSRPGQMTGAEGWDGTSWSAQSIPNPPGEKYTYLSSVSCPLARACMAVGEWSASYNYTDRDLLAERWDGTTWSVRSIPAPAGMIGAELDDVSCASRFACIAIGWGSSASIMGFAEQWNGTTWNYQSLPSPPHGLFLQPHAVSCSSATACTAVGTYRVGWNRFETVADRWNGHRWTVQITVNPSKQYSELLGVSCPSDTSCTAVGGYDHLGVWMTLAEHWNGRTWSTQPTTAPTGTSGESRLDSVSCSSPSACVATGYTDSGSGRDYTTWPFAERWSGATWTAQSIHLPPSAVSGTIGPVSCSSATACTALAAYTNELGDTVPFAERYS
jgi:hypothetical protein